MTSTTFVRTIKVTAVKKADWRSESACLIEPGDWFSEEYLEQLEAKTVCGWCPVSLECLDYALRTRSGAGVWGGFTGEERVKLRRRAPKGRQEYWDYLEREIANQSVRTHIRLEKLPKSYARPERLDELIPDEALAVL